MTGMRRLVVVGIDRRAELPVRSRGRGAEGGGGSSPTPRAGLAVSYPHGWQAQEEPQSGLVVVASYPLAAGAATAPEPRRPLAAGRAFVSLAAIPAPSDGPAATARLSTLGRLI